MKKICFVLSMVLMLTAGMLLITSADAEVYVYQTENFEVTAERGSFTDEQLEAIALTLLENAPGADVQPYGLLCSVVGHDFENLTVVKTTHKKYATSPRCLEEVYRVSRCTRCDYIETVLLSSTRIICCPVD